MTTRDLSAFAADLAVETKAYVTASIARAVDAVAPRVTQLEAEIQSLKAVPAPPGPAGRDGVDGPAGRDGADGAPGRDGADGPAGRDGVDGAPGRDGVNGLPGRDGVDGAPGRDGADGPPGRDGERVPLSDVKALVSDALAVAIAGLPGLVRDEVTRAVAAVPVPKDGRDGKDVDLVAVKTFADAAATTAAAGLPALVRDEVARAVAGLAPPVDLVTATVTEQLKAWPKPQDGAPGPPGQDGTLEALVVEFDDERTITLRRKDGSVLRTITLPIVLDRGVWKPGTGYAKGDGVTWGGSFWIAQAATTAKPGAAGADAGAWRLAVKRGTDGKDGRDGKDAE